MDKYSISLDIYTYAILLYVCCTIPIAGQTLKMLYNTEKLLFPLCWIIILVKISGILEAKVNTELVEEEYITSEIISFSFIAEYHAKKHCSV